LTPNAAWIAQVYPDATKSRYHRLVRQALLERLAANDIPVEEGPGQRWGAHGTGTSVYFRDPENNLIEAKFYGE